jgi:two-component system OmpR family response regulator
VVGKVVLVVDDDQDVRGLLAYALREAGFEVAALADGDEALEFLRTTPATFTVLDLRMPGMDGGEFLRRRKELSIDGPVLILTAASADDARRVLGDFSGVLRLSKPFDLDEFLTVVRAHMST